MCNGRGSCICGGVCKCFADFDFSVYGKYCECDDVNCARGADGDLCSNNGECKCGDCRFSFRVHVVSQSSRRTTHHSFQVRRRLVGRRLQLRREREPVLLPLQREGLLQPRGELAPRQAECSCRTQTIAVLFRPACATGVGATPRRTGGFSRGRLKCRMCSLLLLRHHFPDCVLGGRFGRGPNFLCRGLSSFHNS